MSRLVIPWQSLSTDALQGVIEDFVTREGTEYGAREVDLATKVDQVRAQLRTGKVVIVFDSFAESASIVSAEQVAGYRDD